MQLVYQTLGTPVSAPNEGMVSRRRFVKIKIMVPIKKELVDRLQVDLPDSSEITTYCHYEKINRICRFCGRMGHEPASCADHSRLTTILLGRFNNSALLRPKKGVWMVDSALIPRQERDGGAISDEGSFCLNDIQQGLHQNDPNQSLNSHFESRQAKRPR